MYNKQANIKLETSSHISNRLNTGVEFYNTDIAPPDGLYEPISFDPDKQVWIGTSRKEWMDNLSNMQEENGENCK